MSKQTEALKLALEALESKYIVNCGAWRVQQNQAITALREALAEQPAQQQELYGWKVDGYIGLFFGANAENEAKASAKEINSVAFPLYTSTQPSKPWRGLTDEEKSDLWCESTGRDCVNEDTHVFADAIEAKLREKNA